MTKYEQLKQDLLEAVKIAKETAVNMDDGGTCNMDSCLLFLPGYNEKKTIEAINEAGIDGFLSNHCGKLCYMLDNPIYAQGYQRTEQAEKISKIMKSKGYDTTVFYLMD